jgi:cytochrome c oxidase cbb3-type subunit 3
MRNAGVRAALSLVGAITIALATGASAGAQPTTPPGNQGSGSGVGWPAQPGALGAGSPPSDARAAAGVPAPPPHVPLVATQGYAGGNAATRLLATPVTGLLPGATPLKPTLTSPVANDPQAAMRGMQYFLAFNCVGCHAPNGGGGMGPALSNTTFLYGGAPANIYLTIYQGRPNGMPAWGQMLPDNIIWDLVAYVQSISRAPTPQWGTTVSRQTLTQEQAPAEHVTTTEPWKQMEAFSHGQKPNAAK